MLNESQKIETYKLFGLVAMYSRGSEYKVTWAMSLLEQGLDTEHLAILATLLKPLNAFEVEDYFQRALLELGVRYPCSKQAIEGYVKVLSLIHI